MFPESSNSRFSQLCPVSFAARFKQPRKVDEDERRDLNPLKILTITEEKEQVNLFIEKKEKKQKKGSYQQNKRQHSQSPLQSRTIRHHIIIGLINLLCLLQGATSSNVDDQQVNLPTVIVRGFLNYRTTVDGTVLLFTPDVGGTAVSQSTTQAISSSSSFPSQVRQTSTLSAEQIEPSSISPKPILSTTFSMQPIATSGEESAERESGGTGRGAPDSNWRHISTPPLKPTLQTSFRRVALEEVVATVSAQPDRIAETVAPGAFSEVGDRNPSSGNEQRQQTRPSVQTDDLVPSSSPAAEQATTSRPPGRAARPKRPPLGFSGQGLRASSARLSENPQASYSINGIRRPGLSTTSTTPSPSVGALSPLLQQAGGNGSAAFQSRLMSANAKLRSKFKRPSFNTSSSSSSSSASPETPEVGSISLHESSRPGIRVELLSKDQKLSILQPRMGDIFNPGASSMGSLPAVGSDEVLVAASSANAPNGEHSNRPVRSDADGLATVEAEIQAELPGDSESKPMSRSGEQAPSTQALPSGGLSGALDASMPLNLEGFFSDQAAEANGEQQASEHKPKQVPKEPASAGKKSNNDKLNGWLDTHHNKFVPRSQNNEPSGHLSSQLAANAALAPSFAANIPSLGQQQIKPTPTSTIIEGHKPVVGAEEALSGSNSSSASAEEQESLQMQTITKTYSTSMTTFKTRLVPLQVKSSTAIHTITESYVITKMLTAYQTMPVGEFILPEARGKSPFELFEEQPEASREQPVVQSQPVGAAAGIQPEQPISLESSGKSAGNDFLHDFSSPDSKQQEQASSLAAALLEQQAQEANLAAGLPPLLAGDQLDGLASSLDPAALLADGAINIPDLNNPLVLAAAIQNPQLAAVILAAQQLQLKQRQQNNKLSLPASQHQANISPQQQNLLQPSYSTSFSTVIKPSTYTVRDTMYTTRLVSFKDGRTVRTRTVSEPGSIIEQTLTSMATEVTPVTLTIRPSGLLAGNVAQLATQQPQLANSQATINNALIATQLASLLARRQQQANQLASANLLNPAANNQQQQQQQLAALQQLLSGGQRAQATSPKHFQPNLQQLLHSMQSANSQPSSLSAAPNALAPAAKEKLGGELVAEAKLKAAVGAPLPALSGLATPPLPALPMQPITTTLTSLQVRTYTVHNAFKTIFRTITSTQLITSTILPGGAVRSSQLAQLG